MIRRSVRNTVQTLIRGLVRLLCDVDFEAAELITAAAAGVWAILLIAMPAAVELAGILAQIGTVAPVGLWGGLIGGLAAAHVAGLALQSVPIRRACLLIQCPFWLATAGAVCVLYPATAGMCFVLFLASAWAMVRVTWKDYVRHEPYNLGHYRGYDRGHCPGRVDGHGIPGAPVPGFPGGHG